MRFLFLAILGKNCPKGYSVFEAAIKIKVIALDFRKVKTNNKASST
jgi:hypothetical protein